MDILNRTLPLLRMERTEHEDENDNIDTFWCNIKGQLR